ALNAGKHVLTEARMARNLEEARRMHAAAKAHPDRVAMIVPSPFGLVHDTFIKELIRDDFLGDIREVVVIGADDTFRDYTKFLHWRQDKEISGNNILMMGILHETVSRWIASPSHVFAQSATFEPTRPSPDEQKQVPVTVPESVQILTRYPDGARGIYHMSGSILFGPGKQIHLYGARGTIKVEFGAEEKLYVGRAAQKELTFVELGPEKRGGWRVEEEFIAAIRGTEQVRFTDFDTGLAYMDFTEAVTQSLATNQAVALPIA
ncbi:MAG: Gfo/Idh/MocA family oxidoreductase, partial [Planctomycetaceae bacterium]|nr:Gfo/Idh/MocA family oxidoreductase [Planctomycetaceae bacterium]